jgi:hypothetical protein
LLQGRAVVSALFLCFGRENTEIRTYLLKNKKESDCANIESFNIKIQFLDKIIEKLDFDIETFDNFIDALNVEIERFDVFIEWVDGDMNDFVGRNRRQRADIRTCLHPISA